MLLTLKSEEINLGALGVSGTVLKSEVEAEWRGLILSTMLTTVRLRTGCKQLERMQIPIPGRAGAQGGQYDTLFAE